jgi:hypothetical protein
MCHLDDIRPHAALVHRQRHQPDAEPSGDALDEGIGQSLDAAAPPVGTIAASAAAIDWRPLPVKTSCSGAGRPALLEGLDLVEARSRPFGPGTRARHRLRLPLFRILDHRAIAIIMAATTLAFVGLCFLRGGEVTIRPRLKPKAIAAGYASGITTMVAHLGGPPLAMYLLPLGLGKEIYAGTTSLFFTVGNATKLLPWLRLVQPEAKIWTLMAICCSPSPPASGAGGSCTACWTSAKSIAPAMAS